ncbi:hypothetical protein K8R20_02560 [bacterium]|nr:hypothetical protein [bacterium]
MNKRVVVVGVVVIVVLLGIFLIVRSSDGFSLSSSPKTTSKSVGIELAQEGYISTWVYSSDNPDGGSSVHIRFTPSINLSLVSDDFSVIPTSVEIVNAGFSKVPKIGKSLRLYPTTLSREETCLGNYYEGCESSLSIGELVDMGDSGTFVVSEVPSTYGEVAEYLGPIGFSIYLFDIGSYDHGVIMDRDGTFDSSKMLEYSGISLSDLDCTIEFDVVVKLSDGTQVSKHFKGDIDGSSLDDMFYQGELGVE